MPAAIAVPAIASAIAGGASIYGSRQAANASRRASQIQSRADAEAMQYQREQDAEARRRWEVEQANQKAQFDAAEEERLYTRRQRDEREARLVPLRQQSAAAMGRLGDLLTRGQSSWRSPSQVGRGTLGQMAGRG